MSEHTPGPWTFSEKRSTLVGSNGKPVRFYGDGITITMSSPSQEERDNWELAKAAPELLEALKEATEQLSKNFAEIPESWIRAIAKAENNK